MGKYKTGDKFVIEIGSERLKVGDKEAPILYRIKGFNTLEFDDNGLDRLEQVNGGPTLRDAYDEGYEKGLRDAWECAKMITDFDAGEKYARFGTCFTEDVFKEYSAVEAENRIVEYEIKVGDEVVNSGDKGVVTRVNNSSNVCDVIWFDGSVNEELEKKILRKTGRHYDIKSILEQLKGTEDEV